MERHYDIILHATTSCNYRCSYCDVIKDNRTVSEPLMEDVADFVSKNANYINSFKFFGGEPLLAFNQIKKFLDNVGGFLPKRFEIVTNTVAINQEIGRYFQQYFGNVFFSIDSEHEFDYTKVFGFIREFCLQEQVCFNIVVSPGSEEMLDTQFHFLYKEGFRKFNILPVYFTKTWGKQNLMNLSRSLKNIADIALHDTKMKLYGFQKNNGYNHSLTYSSLFLDPDANCYYSDFVSTHLGKHYKEGLYIGKIQNIDLSHELDLEKQKMILIKREKEILENVKGQKELREIMNYFSLYLNEKSDEL